MPSFKADDGYIAEVVAPCMGQAIWAEKDFSPPQKVANGRKNSVNCLPNELWLTVASYLTNDADDMLALRQTSRFFAYVADTAAPQLFARKLLQAVRDGYLPLPRLDLFPRLFADVATLNYTLLAPHMVGTLQSLLFFMPHLSGLKLQGTTQSLVPELIVPQTVRTFAVSCFTFNDAAAWLSELPRKIENLQLHEGQLDLRAPTRWPPHLHTLTLTYCQLSEQDALNFGDLSHLHTLRLSNNGLHTGERLHLAPSLVQLGLAFNGLQRLDHIAGQQIPCLQEVDVTKNPVARRSLLQTGWPARVRLIGLER